MSTEHRAQSTEHRAQSTEHRIRDTYLDILKGILIILVLVGHFGADAAGESHILNTITVFIDIFHMPVFVFISGYCSKNIAKSRESGFRLLIIFALLQILWAVLSGILFRSWSVLANMWIPGPALWYILALSVWKYYLRDLIKIRYIVPVSFVLAVLSSLTVSLMPVMALPRIVGFLPFFLLGYFVDHTTLEKIKRINIAVSLIILSAIFGLSYFITVKLELHIKILSHNYSYLEFGVGDNPVIGLAANAASYILALVAGIAFISVCKVFEKNRWLIRIGQRTLPIYILSNYIQHGVLRFPGGFLNHILSTDLSRYAVAMLYISITIIICQSDWVVNGFNNLINKWYRLVVPEEKDHLRSKNDC